MIQIVIICEFVVGCCLKVECLNGVCVLCEVQVLCYCVFSVEFDVKFEGVEDGFDCDDYDCYCVYIGVCDFDSGVLVVIIWLFDYCVVECFGCFYSEEEFYFFGFDVLYGLVLEIGCICVVFEYCNGVIIVVFWGEFVEVFNEGGYCYLMGCVSIFMCDGGMQVKVVMQWLCECYLCIDYLQVELKNLLLLLDVLENFIVELLLLFKVYMCLGVKICGEFCWDLDFQVVDVFILFKCDEFCLCYVCYFKVVV